MSTRISSPLLRFATFEVNVEIGEVRRYGHRVKLQGKPFQILVALLERPGALVSREELHQRLWSDDTFVDFDHNLNNAIDKLRKALNDSAEQPEFIETLPRRGYRFIAPVDRCLATIDSQLGGATQPDKKAVSEPTSPLMPMANVGPTHPAQNDWDIAVCRPSVSRGKLIIGSAVAASLLLALLFIGFGFFGPSKFLVRSVYGRSLEITSLVVEKNGGLDPADEGFTLHSIGQYQSNVMRNTAKHGFDRWKIKSNDQAYYYRSLTGAEKRYAVAHDWKLSCVCAVEDGQASANVDFGRGSRRFDIELLKEGDKYYVALTKQVSPEFEWDEKIEFPGAGDVDHPHTYELRYDQSAKTASLWIDGSLMASGYHGHKQFVEDRGLFFGAYSYLATINGVGVFRTVRFEAY